MRVIRLVLLGVGQELTRRDDLPVELHPQQQLLMVDSAGSQINDRLAEEEEPIVVEGGLDAPAPKGCLAVLAFAFLPRSCDR